MIDEIITVSKIEYGRISLQSEVIKITKIFKKLYQLTHLQAINRSLKLQIESPESEIYIKGDYQRFLHALVTLVDTGISILGRGTIVVATNLRASENLAEIVLDFPCSNELWQEEKSPLEMAELTLESVKELSHKVAMSPGMKFILCQTLLEKMGGKLNLIDLSSENPSEPLTRLLLLIPLASDHEVVQSQIED